MHNHLAQAGIQSQHFKKATMSSPRAVMPAVAHVLSCEIMITCMQDLNSAVT